MVYLMDNVTQPYAWGSRTGITDVFGIENPSGEPMAEIWMGAHPKAPSMLIDGDHRVALDKFIQSNPVAVLGHEVASAHGNRLPFLFKILAAGEPLSIQAHPSKKQAEAGFAREEAEGPARDAPDRNYRDDNHKPELIYALTPFWGMRGFRSPAKISANLSQLGMKPPEDLRLPGSDPELPAFFASLMSLRDTERTALIASALDVAERRWPDPDRYPEPEEPDAEYYWVRLLGYKYPSDPGALAPLFLNVCCLEPGKATYQPAGVLHAYLHGVGAEIMANSDNVLRGGLTIKHIDLDELLTVGVFRTEDSVILNGRSVPCDGATCLEFPAPFSDFSFSRIDIRNSCELTVGSPQILLALRGKIRIESDGDGVLIAPGQSVFVRADSALVRCAGAGTILRATTE